MSSNSQLLILGNGFDLQCSLKSSFDDFMKTRLAKVDEVGNLFKRSHDLPDITVTRPDQSTIGGNALSYWLWEKGLTVWDFIFYEDKQKRTWYDIEDCIRTWVDYRLVPENAFNKPPIQQICLDYEHSDHQKGLYINPHIEAKQCVLVYACDFYYWNGKPEMLLSILLDQLHHYEKAFAVYLQEQVDKNHEYSSLATSLLLNLVNDQSSTPALKANSYDKQYLGNSESINILDFNYTYPIMEDWANKPDCLNVHGLANKGNIIFGIDGTRLKTTHECYANIVKFTKTYRLMALSRNPHRSLVRPYLSYSSIGATDMIKFFGHSLGDADYSYFQAIFDGVDLYESNTRLIFYYNEYRRNTKKKNDKAKSAQEEMFEKVYNLISTYGQTLNSKDHGRNLLHKLLLEGRLTIKQSPTYPNHEYYQEY